MKAWAVNIECKLHSRSHVFLVIWNLFEQLHFHLELFFFVFYVLDVGFDIKDVKKGLLECYIARSMLLVHVSGCSAQCGKSAYNREENLVNFR